MRFFHHCRHPNLGAISGWILSLVMVAVVYIYMNHTKSGYEIWLERSTLPDMWNECRWIALRTMMLSAGMCGLRFCAGSETSKTVCECWEDLVYNNNYCMAQQTKPGSHDCNVILFSVMSKGAGFLEYQNISQPPEMIQGIILFCVE